jgi:cytochrome c nitrite reductase small subunit
MQKPHILPRFMRAIGTLPLWGRALLAALAGAILGLGAFTLVYADGFAYLGGNPAKCVNCHAMRPAFEGWNHSSHKNVARCVDCHAPHNVVAKYAVKIIDGVKDMVAFTANAIPEPIKIRPFNQSIVQNQCLSCHDEMVQPISHRSGPEATDCLRCHSEVGHQD